MRQITQRLRDGTVQVLDVPTPAISADEVLVRVHASLLSAGTERTKVATGRQSLIGKARARPDQVRQVIDKAKRDGLQETIQTVRSRLDEPSPLGYSSAGVVLEIGENVRDVAPGDHVACAGAGYANHAEVNRVPANLCVRVPDGVPMEHAAFATVGSIALHGLRQAEIQLGETVAVIGLGLVGQLTAQLARAAGARVLGIDLSREQLELASGTFGIEAVATPDQALRTEGETCDAAIITAASSSSGPVEMAAKLCRDRGRIVVVGAVGMDLPRAPFYDKELDLRLSRSYGPGRYDREYEERGLDYPIGYVRWTERRNLVAFLDLVATGRLNIEDLISRRVPLEEAPDVYDGLAKSSKSPLGIVITYPQEKPPQRIAAASALARERRPVAPATLAIGVLGAGSFAKRVLIPGLKAAGFSLGDVASGAGASAVSAVHEFGFRSAVTPRELLADASHDAVAIATRHSTHAEYALAALEAGKAVFVEKPPALNYTELEKLREAATSTPRPLWVGFNRRYSPLSTAMREHLHADGRRLSLLCRVAAGHLPADHWLNDPVEGGGRLVGEACHFIDLLCWLVGEIPVAVAATASPSDGIPATSAQTFTVTLAFPSGSVAVLLYTEGGSSRVPKEYVEGHAGSRSAFLDDFRQVRLLDGRKTSRIRARRGQDKGHAAQFAGFATAVRCGHDAAATNVVLTTLDSMAVTLAAREALMTGQPVAPRT